MDTLYVPSITGQFANWRYFQIILSVDQIVKVVGYDEDKNPIYKIKTVDEVEEIYSKKGLNNMLQRVFDKNRLLPLTNYLLKQSDKYVNNITVATYGGKPEWLPIGIHTDTFIDLDKNYSESYWETFSKSFGVIQLTGEETIFVLDGQHRIKGLREAIKSNPEIGKEQIALTLISHDTNAAGRKSTRRLFTVINRYAKPVSQGESILLDEDDLSAIITRWLIEEYDRFSKNKTIALNKNANLILPKDDLMFTTAIALWTINEQLINPREIYPVFDGPKKDIVRIRPDDKVIEKYKKVVVDFWELYFKCFPLASNFSKSPDVKYRSNGGLFTLRPIGQFIFADFYLALKKLNKLNKIAIIKKIPEHLNAPFWHNVLFEPASGNIMKSKAYARNYLFYMLNLPLTKKEVQVLKENYRKFTKNGKAELPKRIISKAIH